jgi:4,5-dihydroxyphthalate decarboxylase
VSKLPLTLACWDYDRTRPLLDGRVQPEGIELEILVLRPGETFPRMLRHQEFQVSELSLASYTTLVAQGECPFVAIPVALSKIFRHSCIYVRPDAGIVTPQDLKGKRVGTVNYRSTGVVFMRGLLQYEYGVAAEDMHWFIGRQNAVAERGESGPLSLPQGIRADLLSDDQNLEDLMEAGELDALLSLFIPSRLQRGSPRIARLFPNYKAVEQEYYRRTRIFPIMHTVVIRRDVYEKQPWVARSLYQAFCEARDLAVNGLYDTDALRLSLPWLVDHVEEAWRVFGSDFWSYGLEPNRPALQAIGQYVFEQRLAPRPVSPDELFAPDVEHG